MMLCINQT
ncbi:hypothetical protein EE612_050136 [Oryza sativa]|nr:hypothetical protein EE612_050136 [Oryza sativa]